MKTIRQFKSINLFATERLIAEQLQHSDLDKFCHMHTNPEVMRTLGGLRTAAETLDNLNWNLKQWTDNGFGLWLFYLKNTQEWLGRAGLRRIDIGGQQEIELNYALMPQFWHLGLATEMAKACIEIAFAALKLDNIVCFTLTNNKASQHVMEKVGFQYERTIIHVELPHVFYRMKNPRKVNE